MMILIYCNFPIAFCNVFSKINLINNNNNLRITNAAKTFNKMMILFKAGKSQTKRTRKIFALKDWIEFLNHF
jgi:hypothetical protein